MKQQLYTIIDNLKDELFELGNTLYKTPELGFKEFKSKQIIIDFLEKYDVKVNNEYFETGFEVQIGKGNGPVIGLIAELDAIKTMDHPFADEITSAAHSCGHSLQSTIMVGALVALKKLNILDNLDGTIKVFFTPAEEFCDIEYRAQLIKEGRLKAYSGKENMLVDGLFDECDVILSSHVMGSSNYDYSVDSTLAGFCYKKITFIGKAAHAAIIPHLGINALNIFTLFQSAVGMLRETFVDEDKVRIHGIVTKGGETVNSIPSEVVYECYVRSVNNETIINLNNQLDITASSCAKALGGSVEIENIPGYFPLIQDKSLNNIIMNHVLEFCSADKVHASEVSMAAGDVGDISLFKPTIQFGFGGTRGRVHGTTFEIYDEEKAYIEPIKIVANTIIYLLHNKDIVDEIVNKYEVKMSKEEYKNYLNIKE